MDNWKKYIIKNDDKLSIEEVDDKVWQNVYKAAVPKKRIFIKKIKNAFEDLFKKGQIIKEGYNSRRRYSKLKLAYASVFVLFVIVSFAFKVKTHSKYGDMVSFEVAKYSYLLKTENSKSLFNSFSRISSPSDSSSFLFIKCIKHTNPNAKNIIDQLKVAEGVWDLTIDPIMVEVKESLFSSFLSEAFEIQLRRPKPDDKQVKDKIKDVLKEKGLGTINIQIDAKSHDIFFSAEPVEQNEALRNNKDSIAITPFTEEIKAIGNTDTTKPKTDFKNLPGWKRDLALMTELTTALGKDGLIDNRKLYNLEIKDGELYINGKKQPKEVSDKYRKYFRNDNYTITNDGDQPKSTSKHSESFNFNDKPKAHSDLPKWDPVQYKKDLKLMNLLIDALVKEGLINRNGPYTVQIKDRELIINNQKQPKEISDKMRPFFSGNNYGFMND